MKTIYTKLLFVCVLILLIGCLHYQDAITYLQSQYQSHENKKDYIVTVKTKNKTLKIPLEEYVVGVVAGEMPVSFEIEALKAQVVAARTFVLSRKLNVDNTTNSQVYLTDEQMKKNWGKAYDKNKAKIEKAVKETSYEVMTYQGEYISAMFFSSSNGKTVNCEDYFTGQVAYLKSVDSHWDVNIDPTNTRKKTFTKKELANIFDVTSPQIEITSYTSSGYVKNVIINGKKYTGREVREKLALASSCFQIEMTSKGYTFITKGSGHGVGMSQYGAQAMAKENKNYKDILNHYYQNIKITSIES
ncbi:stage II sporulation protein D [Candidatus Stoquefichus massiliensis]|uniref:stage II sporulation protein D n=1 Tax=Candidatus Stoquefichus massiliensis TaxID=1470350 RepID=UPI0004856BEB|nr:stage II sporulation protein D [Candidatus Stoquefichus massiliensis]